ncbi:PhnB protein [Chitinophaga sp. CF118]|uniref:VOC family protein n=1 Tax=Chitinophaga sp. CF118 TaxID=1884367 RepID=UPI0008EC7DB9|nr:VOC family protein [Chitinophaga sp. CF118]SFF00967.1 PhnB protein [Chitinophaga sp. CF118]
MKLIPYLHFQGNCEEALNHYKKVLNGTAEIVSRYDDPNMKAPEGYKNKVLHALFTFEDNSIMASDSYPDQELKAGENVALSLSLKGDVEATRIFNELSEGGQILMPLEKQFWGDLFGYFVDRYGIRWMVNAS